MKSRFQERYEQEIKPRLAEKYDNPHKIPKLEKIVINMGVGDATQNRAHIDRAVEDMTVISGQKPIVTRARKSNASFKVRENMAIGCKVTLRGAKMFEFLDRLVTIALPRVRDFRGISAKSFDGRGNYAMGIKEHTIFPEVDYDKVDKIRGMDIIICTTANSNEEAKVLLEEFDMPFKKENRS